MEPYVVNMVPSTFVAACISLLHDSMIAHAHDPFSEFHSIMVRACRLLWSLPTVAPWVEYRICYHDFMMTGGLGYHYLWVAAQRGV